MPGVKMREEVRYVLERESGEGEMLRRSGRHNQPALGERW